jgi:predicted O-linked N-acetylglucosamine transferase (SPINDLY family)
MGWLGYLSTTGLSRVDFRISDPVADPEGMTEALHTERLLRMPHSQWCFRPSETALHTAVMRDASLRAFTFGAFNQFAKVTDATLGLWIDVMQAIPAARLRLVGVPRGTATEMIIRAFVESNVDRMRFDLVERVSLADYYREYGRVDACLDTTPYSGGTTTCDALWMGVPVITLSGARSVSRSSASLLSAIGLADLVARSRGEFVAIALRLADQGGWPTPARSALRERMVTSPLMDEQGFTEDLEALYREAWHGWCGGRRSTPIPEGGKVP